MDTAFENRIQGPRGRRAGTAAPALFSLSCKGRREKACRGRIELRVPGAAQRVTKGSGALQTRDPGFAPSINRGPGSAVHHVAPSRAEDARKRPCSAHAAPRPGDATC